jgi:hypothetical protein
MKKIFMIVISILLLSFGVASAASLFGPTEGASKPYASLGYSFDSLTMHPNDGANFKTESNQWFLQSGYGWSGSELYIRAGFSDLRATPEDGSSSLTAAYSPYVAVGGKYFYRINEAWGIGPFIQVSSYFSGPTQNVNGADVTFKDWWDTAIGASIQYKPTSKIKLYAGPYVYWSQGTIQSPIMSTNFGSASNWGGYLGAEGKINDKVSVTAEGKYSDYINGALMFNYSF